MLFDSGDPAIDRMAAKLYGEKPRQLTITFTSDDPEAVFPQYLKRYRRSVGCVCKGDGVKAMEGDDMGRLTERSCPCEKLKNKECRQVATLEFMLPDFPVIGTWAIDTGSTNSIISVNSGLELARELFGRIHMIPFRLSLDDREKQVEGKKKIVRVLGLKVIGDPMKSKLAQITTQSTALLEAADDEMDPEIKQEMDEFQFEK